MATRSKKNVYLLSSTITQLTGSKLPSVRMALGLFLHHHIDLNLTIHKSSSIVIKEILSFWRNARIPTQDIQNCQKKLEKLFEEWRLLKKNKGRKSCTQKSKENAFTAKFDNLFDIAHANAINIMKIEEDKDFLIAQGEEGRRGCMAGLDNKLASKEKRAIQREDNLKRRKLKALHEMKNTMKADSIELSSDDSSSSRRQKIKKIIRRLSQSKVHLIK